MEFAKGQNVIEVENASDIDIAALLKKASHFAPAYDRVLIKRELSSLERRTQKSGIVLTDQTKETTMSAEGYICGYGPTANQEAKNLLGKRVLFSKYTGDDIFVPLPDGTREQFILAVDKDIYGELK